MAQASPRLLAVEQNTQIRSSKGRKSTPQRLNRNPKAIAIKQTELLNSQLNLMSEAKSKPLRSKFKEQQMTPKLTNKGRQVRIQNEKKTKNRN